MTTMKRFAKVQLLATCILTLSLMLSACNGGNDKPIPEKPVPDKPTPEKPVPEKPNPKDPIPGQPNPEKPAPEQPEENKMIPKFLIKTFVNPDSYYGAETTAYTYDGEKRIISIKVSTAGDEDHPTEKTYAYNGNKVTIKNYYAPKMEDKQNLFYGDIVKNFNFISSINESSTKKSVRTISPESVVANRDGRIISYMLNETYTDKANNKVIKNQEQVTITWSGDNISTIKVEKGELGKEKKPIMELAFMYSNIENLTNLSIIQGVGRTKAGDQVLEMNTLSHNAMQPKNFPSEIVRTNYTKSGKVSETFRYEYQMDSTHNRPTSFTKQQDGGKKEKYLITY